MGTRTDHEDVRDTSLEAEESDAEIDAWTLEEIDDLADLGSVRWLQAGGDDVAA
jgi:hypothetical protein